MSPPDRTRAGCPVRWFPPAAPGVSADVTLFCLPHAGAGASAYRSWTPLVRHGIEIVPVQLAGREARFADPALSSGTEIVDQLVEPLIERAAGSFALFGHSMGALLGYELAATLTDRHRPPSHLFVSGLNAPHVLHPGSEPTVHLLPDDELAGHIGRLQGTAAEVLASPELLRLVLPAIRADYAVCETYVHCPRPPLSVPFTVLSGVDDPATDPASLHRWNELTTAPSAFREFPGDHFYLHARLDTVLDLVVQTLCRSRLDWSH